MGLLLPVSGRQTPGRRRQRRAPAILAATAAAVCATATAAAAAVVCSSGRGGPQLLWVQAPPLRTASWPRSLLDSHTDEASEVLGRRDALLLSGGASSAWAAGPLAASADALVAKPPKVDSVKLNNGLAFPKASFGLQVYGDDEGQRLTELALSVGYRNFFASVLAGNQKGFARGVQNSGIPRDELFICGTVLSNRARGFEAAYQLTKRGCNDNMRDLGVGGITYVDMIMLDYPAGDCESIRGQWKAFEEMLAAGQTKSLAVSNFSPEQLDCLLSQKGVTKPTVNQLPYSVVDHDPTAVAENGERGIVVQAWSPLASGRLGREGWSVCRTIGEKYGKSAAQVALRWIVQSGATFSTQTKSKAHFEEDLNVFDFELTAEEMKQLGSLSRGRRGLF